MLPNISRSQSDNEIGQLIEYNIRNMLLEKLYTNEVQKPFPDPYLKNQNWTYLWIGSLLFHTVWFYGKLMAIKIY